MVSFFTQKTHRRFLGYSWEMRVLCSGFQSNMSKVTPPRNVISTNLTPQTTCSLGISLPLPHFPAVMLGPWVPPHCSWTALTWLTQTKFGYWHLSLLRAYHLDSLWNSFFQTNLYLFHFFFPFKVKNKQKEEQKSNKEFIFYPSLHLSLQGRVWEAPFGQGRTPQCDLHFYLLPNSGLSLESLILTNLSTNAPVLKRPNHSRQLLGAIYGWQLTRKVSSII